ncbi:MAG: hypothetical protein NZ480_05415 [Bdellovibrionaceae bacterium]|nr:hypothetical protein [Pseudobdellovibrionaceae bacterium]MDW8190459.1 hypothetical protein [Pseudobdellovibrionaceae bacterium]
MDFLLDFLINKNTTAIVIFSSVLSVSVIILIMRTYLFNQTPPHDTSQSSTMSALPPEQLEKLEKMLENLSQITAKPADLESQNKINELQLELKKAHERLKEIEKTSSSNSSAENVGAEVTVYLNKIKDLEAKLSEYEIIAEDLAELSRVKEENKKLKKMLEQNSIPNTDTVSHPSQSTVTQIAIQDTSSSLPIETHQSDSVSSPTTLETASNEATLTEGSINLSHLEKEVAQLEHVTDSDRSANLWEGQLNPDKLIKEADELQSKQEDVMLLNEFENFVKEKKLA